MTRTLSLLLALMLATACTADDGTADATPAAVNTAPTGTAPAPADATPDEPAPAADDQPSAPTRIAQAEPEANDAAPAQPLNRPARYQAGTHYNEFVPAKGTLNSSPDRIEVVEVFMYTCPHCYSLEPLVDAWLKDKPSNVDFVRLPALFNQTAALHARVFYTAEALGVLDEIHTPFFRALHVERKRMTSEKELTDFFAEHGVSAEDFAREFKSFGVDSKVRRAQQYNKRYQISSTPTVIVNGKYTTSGGKLNSQREIFDVVDELIAKEAARDGTG